jgi:peptidoglycan hydrolase CwlO-like protein
MMANNKIWRTKEQIARKWLIVLFLVLLVSVIIIVGFDTDETVKDTTNIEPNETLENIPEPGLSLEEEVRLERLEKRLEDADAFLVESENEVNEKEKELEEAKAKLLEAQKELSEVQAEIKDIE